MKLSIVMPAFNERRTIREIINRVLTVDLGDLERELVIVDDGSSDGTREILAEYAASAASASWNSWRTWARARRSPAGFAKPPATS